MDIIIGDLAAQYALQTENDATDTFLAGATAATTNLATGANTAEQVAAAFWGAVGQVYAGTKGAGPRARRDGRRRCSGSSARSSPRSTRRTPSRPASRPSTTVRVPMGTISGVPIYVTAGLADNKILVLSTAAAEVYEDRIGALSVVEPSVLGVQVAYAGHFTPLIVEATGIIAITKTP